MRRVLCGVGVVLEAFRRGYAQLVRDARPRDRDAGVQVFRAAGKSGHLVRKHRPTDEHVIILGGEAVQCDRHVFVQTAAGQIGNLTLGNDAERSVGRRIVPAVIEDAASAGAREAMARARAHFPGAARIEEFLPGREFAVSLWGHSEPDCACASETVFESGMRLNTYRAKWWTESDDYKNTPMRYDTEVSPELRNAVIETARGAWCATGARGYLRVDVRQNSEGIPCVMDVNPNPALAPARECERHASEDVHDAALS